MKNKNLFITLGIVFAVLIGIVLILNFFGPLSALNVMDGSTYKSFKSNSNEIVYSNPIENLYLGFSNKHYLADNGNQMCSKCAFDNPSKKWTSAYSYLDLSGWTQSDSYYVSGGETFSDATKDSYCEVTGKITALCQDDAFIKPSVCEAINYPYSFYGTVSYVYVGGFVCNLDGAKEQLFDELPKRFSAPSFEGNTIPVGNLVFEGEVIFKRGKNPCYEITCEDKCENSIWYHGGKCVEGNCVYISQENCQYGCQNEPLSLLLGSEGMCRDDPCVGVDCEDYCIGDKDNSLATEGECVNGKCVYLKSGEIPFSEECGWKPWYENMWIWVGGGILLVGGFIFIFLIGGWWFKRK